MSQDLIGKYVTITADNLGGMSKTGGRMVDRTFPKGTQATVTLKLPMDEKYQDWYALEVSDDDSLYIPAHVSMFEVVA